MRYWVLIGLRNNHLKGGVDIMETEECEQTVETSTYLNDELFDTILKNSNDITSSLYKLKELIDHKIYELTGCRPPGDCNDDREVPQSWTNKVRTVQEHQRVVLGEIFDIVELL